MGWGRGTWGQQEGRQGSREGGAALAAIISRDKWEIDGLSNQVRKVGGSSPATFCSDRAPYLHPTDATHASRQSSRHAHTPTHQPWRCASTPAAGPRAGRQGPLPPLPPPTAGPKERGAHAYGTAPMGTPACPPFDDVQPAVASGLPLVLLLLFCCTWCLRSLHFHTESEEEPPVVVCACPCGPAAAPGRRPRRAAGCPGAPPSRPSRRCSAGEGGAGGSGLGCGVSGTPVGRCARRDLHGVLGAWPSMHTWHMEHPGLSLHVPDGALTAAGGDGVAACPWARGGGRRGVRDSGAGSSWAWAHMQRAGR